MSSALPVLNILYFIDTSISSIFSNPILVAVLCLIVEEPNLLCNSTTLYVIHIAIAFLMLNWDVVVVLYSYQAGDMVYMVYMVT